MTSEAPRVTAIDVVADRTAESTCTDGFLKLRRLRLRNRHADGGTSDEYSCDILSREHVDAVVISLYEIDDERRVWVVLKEGVRPAVYLRKDKPLFRPDPREYLTVTELAAGVLESEDAAAGGVAARAAAEAWEECGLRLLPAIVARLGGEMFPSPGVTDEKVYFRSAPVAVADAQGAMGDGSVMEEATHVVVLELADAVARCRRGEIPDMKTEIGLLRLAEAIGYLPQLDAWVDDLPDDLRARWAPLGLDDPGDA